MVTVVYFYTSIDALPESVYALGQDNDIPKCILDDLLLN